MLGGKFGAQFSQICGAIYILARVRRIQSTCHLQHLYLAMLPIWRRFFHYGVDRFSLTGPCQKLKKTGSDSEHRALLSERLGQAMEGSIETGHDILPCLACVAVRRLLRREKIFRYSFQYRFRFASRLMRRINWYFNSFLAHGWRRGSRMALDHSLSLIYSLNSGSKIRLLPPLLCIAFVPSALCAYVFGRL